MSLGSMTNIVESLEEKWVLHGHYKECGRHKSDLLRLFLPSGQGFEKEAIVYLDKRFKEFVFARQSLKEADVETLDTGLSKLGTSNGSDADTLWTQTMSALFTQ